jgi:hypothetical protein
MKKLIFQFFKEQPLFHGDERDTLGVQIVPYSIRTVSNYAQRIGADYKFVSNRKFNHLPSVHSEKLQCLMETGYDKVLALDTDIIIPPDTEIDIFNEYRHSQLALRGSPKHLGLMSRINGGVVLWDKQTIELVQPMLNELLQLNTKRDLMWHDEHFIQSCWMEYDIGVTGLKWEWNRNGEEYHDWKQPAYFIHYGAVTEARLAFDKKHWDDRLCGF